MFRSPDYYMAALPRAIKQRVGVHIAPNGTKTYYEGKEHYYLTVQARHPDIWFVGYTCKNDNGQTVVWKFAEAVALNDAFDQIEQWLVENEYMLKREKV